MSSPTNSEKDDLIRAVAKQAYKHELLVKTLRARGYLDAREPESLESADEFDSFLKIFRLYSRESTAAPRNQGSPEVFRCEACNWMEALIVERVSGLFASIFGFRV